MAMRAMKRVTDLGGVTDERGGNGSEKTSAKTKPKTNKRWKMDIRGR